MLRAWKLRVARRAFERAAYKYAEAIADLSVPIEVAVEARVDMERARARIWELRS
jgi:hypothetical protein